MLILSNSITSYGDRYPEGRTEESNSRSTRIQLSRSATASSLSSMRTGHAASASAMPPPLPPLRAARGYAALEELPVPPAPQTAAASEPEPDPEPEQRQQQRAAAAHPSAAAAAGELQAIIASGASLDEVRFTHLPPSNAASVLTFCAATWLTLFKQGPCGPEEHRIDAFQLRNEAGFINDFRDDVTEKHAAKLARSVYI